MGPRQLRVVVRHLYRPARGPWTDAGLPMPLQTLDFSSVTMALVLWWLKSNFSSFASGSYDEAKLFDKGVQQQFRSYD